MTWRSLGSVALSAQTQAPPTGRRISRHRNSTGKSEGSAEDRRAALGETPPPEDRAPPVAAKEVSWAPGGAHTRPTSTAALALLPHSEPLQHQPRPPRRKLPAGLWDVLAEGGREGLRWHLSELQITCMPTHRRIHLQISTNDASSHLSTTLPTTERSGDEPVASGRQERWRHPHLAGVLPAAVVRGSPGAQTTRSPLLQPWGPQDPGEALGDEQARGHVPIDAPGQARLEVTRLSAKKLLTLKGRPDRLQGSRSKAPHAPPPGAAPGC